MDLSFLLLSKFVIVNVRILSVHIRGKQHLKSIIIPECYLLCKVLFVFLTNIYYCNVLFICFRIKTNFFGFQAPQQMYPQIQIEYHNLPYLQQQYQVFIHSFIHSFYSMFLHSFHFMHSFRFMHSLFYSSFYFLFNYSFLY